MVKSKLVFLIVVFFIFTNSLIFINALPTYFDWRNKEGQDWMTSVKNQWYCGSCWAFSAVGVVETQYNIAKNQSNYDLDLSEENLVSNCSVAGSCAGGWHNSALSYIKNMGIVNESCFPYVDSYCTDSCGCAHGCSNAECSDNQCTSSEAKYKIDNYENIPNNITEIENWLVNHGPVSVAMLYGGFLGGYWSGDIYKCFIEWDYNHAVIITGYNQTGQYWIVKNSWGLDWPEEGDDGYFKVGFDECSIQSAVYGVDLTLCSCTGFSAGSCGDGGCLSSERQYTRTCTPSACDVESACVYSSSCSLPGPGSSLELTVCASGCNYTSIQNAMIHSDSNDKILVTDSATYPENIVINSTTSHWLECQAGAVISGPGGNGISVYDVDDFVITGCYITDFGKGIYLNNAQRGLIQNNTLFTNTNGIYLENESEPNNEITYNNITAGENGQYAIRLEAPTWSLSNNYNNIKNNIITGHSYEGILIDYGIYTLVKNNTIYDNGNYGIHVYGKSTNGWNTFEGNLVYRNTNGIYIQQSQSTTIDENIFCSSNTNLDIYFYDSTSQSGDNNRCEKPGVWNDAGTTGCTYYCDNPAESILLYPPNNFISDIGNVSLICEGEDDYQLKNISLYVNISGTWQINQTKNVTGTSNITTFSLYNLTNNTNFIWNCLVYDNKSRGGFASANWTMNIKIILPPPNDTYKFYHKNSTGQNVAWLGNEGNIVLKGKCYSGGNCNNPGSNSIIFGNSTDNYVAFINSTGDLCLEKGDCSDESANCNSPSDGSFIIKNSTNNNVIYIDRYGDLCMIGKLYENSQP